MHRGPAGRRQKGQRCEQAAPGGPRRAREPADQVRRGRLGRGHRLDVGGEGADEGTQHQRQRHQRHEARRDAQFGVIAQAPGGLQLSAARPAAAGQRGQHEDRDQRLGRHAPAGADRAVVEAGLTLQIDDPSIAENFDQINPEPSIEDYRAFTRIRVEALNHALRGLPTEQIRFHLCWGSWHGPHTTDVEFKHIVDLMLEINAGSYSFEAANVRHEHEWKVWENVKLPDGKMLMPGVVSHCVYQVEHPELVAQRIERFARVVGRENVIAGNDCGFATAAAGDEVHADVAWAKLQALAEGAEIASRRLWR